MKRRWTYAIVLILPFIVLTCARREVKVVEEEPVVEEVIKEEAPKPVVEEEVKVPIKFTTIHFDFDKYNIRSGDARILEQNAEVLKAHPDVKILIEGHCCEIGTNEYNLALGARRANAARDYLIKLGISKERMSTISYGEERPIDPGHTEAARSKNRRAEFVIK